MSQEQKDKIRKARTGKKHTMETKLIISQKNKGKPAWNKGVSNPSATKNLGEYAKGLKGKDSPNWKGGVVFVGGYYYVYNEKLGTQFGGKYIKRANLVWYEEKGEIIKEPYFLHHNDWDMKNDRIENLTKMKRGEHSKFTTMHIPRGDNGRFVK